VKFIDLFAGLGGFHVALKNARMRCVFASEIDNELRELYQKNFDMECHGDITQIPATSIPAHDILCAGFPCQPFSKAGKQRGLDDTERGLMFREIITILSVHRPKYFILENVPHLRNHNNKQTWNTIKEKLLECGYLFHEEILSPHHFGIPHRRERLFVIGWQQELGKINLQFHNTDIS